MTQLFNPQLADFISSIISIQPKKKAKNNKDSEIYQVKIILPWSHSPTQTHPTYTPWEKPKQNTFSSLQSNRQWVIVVGTIFCLTFKDEIRGERPLDGFFRSHWGSRAQWGMKTPAENSKALGTGELGKHDGLQKFWYRSGGEKKKWS